jgi:hypothetical protein
MNPKISEFLSGQNYRTFTYEDPDFDYLQDDEELAVVRNPYAETDLYIKSSPSELSLSFAEWTGVYENTIQGSQALIKDAQNIMNDDSYVWKIDMGELKMVGLVNDTGTYFCQMAMAGNFALSDLGLDEYSDLFEPIDQQFFFWNPEMLNPEPSPLLN